MNHHHVLIRQTVLSTSIRLTSIMGEPGPSRRSPRSTLVSVLSLCLPYALASPLPSPHVHPEPYRSAAGVQLAGLSARQTLSNGTFPSSRWSLITMDAQGLYTLPQGYVKLHPRINGGFVVLSYLIAVVGSLCTLELLVRRTTNSGWRNKVLLLAAGVTFGSVSTFAMHFIFNNSLSLHHPLADERGYRAVRLSYDAGFTILSLVASCLAMTMAFFVMGTSLRSWTWLLLPIKWCRQSRNRRASVEKDEYGQWKALHDKVLGRRSLWKVWLGRSGLRRPSTERRGSSRKSQTWQETVMDQTEEAIRNDKKLQEMDFRLGRQAVLQEIAKRSGTTPLQSSPRKPVLDHRPHSALSYPPPKSTTAPRRPSVISDSSYRPLFIPGYAFPSKTTESISSMPHTASHIEPTPLASSDSLVRPASYAESHDVRPSSDTSPSDVAATQTPSKPSLQPDANAVTSLESTTGSELRRQISASDSIDKKDSIEPSLDEISNGFGTPLNRSRRSSRVFTTVERFLGFDVVTKTDVTKIFVTGTIAGCGVVGMHYIGQLSITNMPYVAYKAEYVVGSVIIACGAVIIALYIMFIMLRPKLKHTWLSKIAVALILAVAVCAMHFCGMSGTTYGWPRDASISKENSLAGMNRALTAVVACLALFACLTCCVFFALHSLKLSRERARRRRVVVASVLMDMHNRVLVKSTDGMLPMCDIADLTGQGLSNDSGRSFSLNGSSPSSNVLGMNLTPGHSAFVNALAMSWGWKDPSLAQTHPNLARFSSDGNPPEDVQHLTGRRGSHTTIDTAAEAAQSVQLSVVKFLERFSHSSTQLAIQLTGQKDGVSRLGVLYDQILTT